MNTFFYTSKKRTSSLQPSYYASGVLDIDYHVLYRNGVRCIAFDVDGTITKSGASTIELAESQKLVALLKDAHINTCILASNSERDLSLIAKKLPGFITVQPHIHKPKPSKSFYRAVIKAAQYNPEQIAMVGDRYIQDIWGARRSGLCAVLIAMQPNHASTVDKLLFRDKWHYPLTKFLAKLHTS